MADVLKYVLMRRDELGYVERAFGTPFLESVHSFPKYDFEDDAMATAFSAWCDKIEERGQKEWEENYGSESKIFLEAEYSSLFGGMSLWALEEYAREHFEEGEWS